MCNVVCLFINKLCCADVNECTEGMMPCGVNAQCLNLEGSHRCFCLEGYEGNATTTGCESKTSSDIIDLCVLIVNKKDS